MPTLLAMASVRNPMPAPTRRPDQQPIETHATATSVSNQSRTAATLHDRLYAAFQESDWHTLVAGARSYLDSAGWRSPTLNHVGAAAATFLRADRIAATEGDLQQFMGGFSAPDLKNYLSGAFEPDRGLLADHALALHCLGALGEAEYDPIGDLRSLHAFAAMAAIVVSGDREPRVPLKNLRDRYTDIEVLLPHWTFEIDICGQPHFVLSKRDAPPTPLERRLQRMERMKAGAAGNCDCSPGEPMCTPQSVCCPELKYYIADLLELRTWTHRYKAGDLAYIEVVGAGEGRVRQHEMKRTDEVYVETDTTVRSLEKRDQQVTDTGKLSREISRQTDAKLSGKASVEGSYDNKVYKVSTSASLSFDRDQSQAIKEAQEQSRTVVTSAVSELEKQVKQTTSERVTTEETETNTHTWTNTDVDPKVTKYFWVTQEMRAQLYNHGKRLMTELIIPSPARLYERLVKDRIENEVHRRVPAFTLTAPQAPPPFTLTPSNITRSNYQQLAQQYGVTNAPSPPDAVKYVIAQNTYQDIGNHRDPQAPMSVEVPDGYEAVQMDLAGECQFREHGTGAGRVMEFTVGNYTIWFDPDGGKSSSSLPNLTGHIDITVVAANVKVAGPNITFTCVPNAATMAAWVQSVFDLIKSAYDDKTAAYQAVLKTYNDAKAAHDAAEDAVRKELTDALNTRDPFYNRQFEATEIKRAAIYLMCEDYSNVSAWIRKAEPCGLPEIDRHETAERGYGWYFWDRLFEWQYMAYAFFDYFWNPICDWPERFDPASADPIFKSFLGAGYARIILPVSQGMEQDFLWYAATLQKWGQTGTPPLDPSDPRWRNVLFELKFASECAMTPREGFVANVSTGDMTILVQGSDRYWNPVPTPGAIDPAAVAGDLDRELFIDGDVYRVSGIQLDANSPAYSGADTMWWRLTLDRPYEGASSPRQLYAMGAQIAAPAFSFDMPTELIWAGPYDPCLPTYPLPPCPP